MTAQELVMMAIGLVLGLPGGLIAAWMWWDRKGGLADRLWDQGWDARQRASKTVLDRAWRDGYEAGCDDELAACAPHEAIEPATRTAALSDRLDPVTAEWWYEQPGNHGRAAAAESDAGTPVFDELARAWGQPAAADPWDEIESQLADDPDVTQWSIESDAARCGEITRELGQLGQALDRWRPQLTPWGKS